LGEIKNIYINWKHLGEVHQPNQIWQFVIASFNRLFLQLCAMKQIIENKPVWHLVLYPLTLKCFEICDKLFSG